MPRRREAASGILARIRGIWPQGWPTGQIFRSTLKTLSRYAAQHVKPKERVEQVPDILWRGIEGAASEKHARALSDYADVENKKIEAEYLRRTLESRARLQEAEADVRQQDARIRASEARIRQIDEIKARLDLFVRLKEVGYLPVWDGRGKFNITAAPNSLLDALGPALLTPEERAIVGLIEIGGQDDAAGGNTGNETISPDHEPRPNIDPARAARSPARQDDAPSTKATKAASS